VPEASITEKCKFITEIIKSTDHLTASTPFTKTIDIQISYFSDIRSSKYYLWQLSNYFSHRHLKTEKLGFVKQEIGLLSGT